MTRYLFAVLISLMSMSATAKNIVVLGDSISAAYGIPVEQGWAALVQQKLEQKGLDYIVRNESISGEITAGGLARLNRALYVHKPALVIIELGTNDGIRRVPLLSIKNNLAEIIHRSQQAGAKILLLGLKIPSIPANDLSAFYAIYSQLASEPGVSYVPLISDDAALSKDMLQADGLHPNAQGQSFIADKVWPQLLPLLQ